jgi:hypothetical protein
VAILTTTGGQWEVVVDPMTKQPLINYKKLPYYLFQKNNM